ncbi:hypothetical protein A2881_00775 [Candidatus Peribacteria bacterium RIFCSPHIGHO2_01_FULL_55_13]|nr:MAG: hypothetical protein A2881_00775 [Candidatus Peribacteria bacterium RIFCSPHIGHO2_01_FULL_55_13]OGJ66124.1 MAG: hypothetical protein A3F36_01305 [Candidatus Peribacteria bacterium RIFCSPHIGHO2_12_FULL_55_11]
MKIGKHIVTTSDWIAIGAAIISAGSLWVSFLSWQTSSNSLESEGPDLKFVEDVMEKQPEGHHMISYELNNFGERPAKDIQIETCFFTQKENSVVPISQDIRDLANGLSPREAFAMTGSLKINPEPRYVVRTLRYFDELIDRPIQESFFYVVDSSQKNGIHTLDNSDTKQVLLRSLSSCAWTVSCAIQ